MPAATTRSLATYMLAPVVVTPFGYLARQTRCVAAVAAKPIIAS